MWVAAPGLAVMLLRVATTVMLLHLELWVYENGKAGVQAMEKLVCLFALNLGACLGFHCGKTTLLPGQGGDGDAFPCQGSNNWETTGVCALCFHIKQCCRWVPLSFVVDPEHGFVPTRGWSFPVRAEVRRQSVSGVSGETFLCY